MTSPLQIREGRYYARADGSVHGPAEKNGGSAYPWIVRMPGERNPRAYTDTGYWYACGGRHPDDLIREVPAPHAKKPRAKAKRNMVVRWCFTINTGVIVNKTKRRAMASRALFRKPPATDMGPLERHEFTAPVVQKGKR